MIAARYVVAAGFFFMLLSACSFDGPQKGTFMNSYYQALKDTDPQKRMALQQGSAEEEQAIAQFRDFYRVFSADTIRTSMRTLYAQDAYFRDGFRAVQGIDNLEKYFLSTTEAFEECAFDIEDIAVHEGNYYFRWIMTLTLKRNKDDRIQTVGMSHVRFDKTGKITFHQDYWDTGVIYEKIPVLGTIITWIRQRI
jgi:hypothetical protein